MSEREVDPLEAAVLIALERLSQTELALLPKNHGEGYQPGTDDVYARLKELIQEELGRSETPSL